MPSNDTNREPIFSRVGINRAFARPTPASWLYAAVGALAGLILGLIIAWLIWPVQWAEAWPADLSQEARAQYLAAVSEAYVYYGDDQAVEVARNRLFNLNDNLATEIASAQRFFADNPQASSRVYINNLGQLARGLDVQSPDIILDIPLDADAAAVVPPATENAAVGDSVRAWVNWALTVLAAVILVAGGFYVVGKLNQRRLARGTDTLDDETEGFDDEPGSLGNVGYTRPSTSPGSPTVNNPYARPMRGAPSSVAASLATPGSSTLPREDYAFEEDDSDDLYSSGTPLDASNYRDEEDVFEEPLDDEEEIFAPRRVLDATDDLDDEDEALGEQDHSMADAAVAAPMQRTANRGAPPPLRTLNTYTFQFHTGIPDYDQSRPIVDPETGLQVGDCGMGVNMKKNSLQDNPDNVIALDVWLVDKKQEKSFDSQDRVLLSEYVVDNNLEKAFTRDRPNEPSPIIPQTGTTFQIKGPSLTLDCVVTDAQYIKNGTGMGMFQSLSIDMTVHSRG
jgi:hypothetical protein